MSSHIPDQPDPANPPEQYDLGGAVPSRNPPAGAHRVVFRFPLDRRRAKIRKVADVLASRKTEEGRTRYWARITDELASELQRHGADGVEVDREIALFHRAVAAELERLSE